MKLQGKLAVVVGLGESGLAMAKWLSREGARVRVADSRLAPPNREAFIVAMIETNKIRAIDTFYRFIPFTH